MARKEVAHSPQIIQSAVGGEVAGTPVVGHRNPGSGGESVFSVSSSWAL